MSEFEGWTSWLEPAYLLWKPTDPNYKRNSYITRTVKDKVQLTPEQEFAQITKEVNESDGFDIDFRPFLCIFNYHHVTLHVCEFSEDGSETNENFLKKLALESLYGYNGKYDTEYEFIKVVKANFHFACAIMYLITFQVKDPYDDKIKLFQTRVRHGNNITTDFFFCRPKPNQGVEYIGIKKNVEKVVKRDFEEVVKRDGERCQEAKIGA